LKMKHYVTKRNNQREIGNKAQHKKTEVVKHASVQGGWGEHLER